MNKGFKNMQVFEDHPDLKELLKEDENGMFGAPAVGNDDIIKQKSFMDKKDKTLQKGNKTSNQERGRAMSLRKSSMLFKQSDLKLRKEQTVVKKKHNH